MPKMNPIAPYASTRLLMRPPVADDLPRFYAIFGDPDTQRFNPAGPIASEEQARLALTGRIENWAQHGYGSWAIALREQPEWVIGFGGLSWRPLGAQRTVNLGYRFDTQVWGSGLATELAQASLEYGFKHLQLTEISAIVLCAKKIWPHAACWKKRGYVWSILWMTCPAIRQAWFTALRAVSIRAAEPAVHH